MPCRYEGNYYCFRHSRLEALPRLDIVRGNRLCGSAADGILARRDARQIRFDGGLVVAFFLRPNVTVDSEATSLVYRRSASSGAKICVPVVSVRP